MFKESQKLAQNAETVADILRLLANSKRLIILCHISKEEKSVGEIASLVNMSDSAISQHLTKLHAFGIVKHKRQRKEIFYSLADRNIKKIMDTLYNLYCK